MEFMLVSRGYSSYPGFVLHEKTVCLMFFILTVNNLKKSEHALVEKSSGALRQGDLSDSQL